MYPVLGTMMPEICEAPHLPVFFLHPSQCTSLNGVGCVHYISLRTIILYPHLPHDVVDKPDTKLTSIAIQCFCQTIITEALSGGGVQ
ncbi:hypothetical protein GTL21_005056 [Salmonella enterica]|nr:hypothetical protein [Salmonella enterica]